MNNSTKFAFIWNTLETFGKQIISVFTTIFLARILDPKDFGLIGMVYVFVAIATAFVEGGFTSALIYKKKPTQNDYSSTFYFTIFISVLLYFILYFSSDAISKFYNQPLLLDIIKILSFSFVFGGLSVVHFSIYSRQMDFKAIAKVGLIAQIISSIAAITTAFSGLGVWSLVIQHLVLNITTPFLFFSKNIWWPKRLFHINRVKSLFKYGSHVMLTSLLNVIFNNIYNIVIGKFFNSIQLGYYVQAHKIQNIPADKMQQIIRRVTFPRLTQIAEDKKKTTSYFLKIFNVSLLVNFGLLIYVAAMSKQIILILLTQKWEPIIPFIKLLCFASLFLPIFELCSNVVLSNGKSLLNFKIEFIKKVLIVLNILIMFKWGITGLIVGQIINSILFLVIQYYFTKQFILLYFKDIIFTIFKYFTVAMIPYLVVLFLMNAFEFNVYIELVLYSIIFFSIYILLIFSFKLNQNYSIKSLLKTKKI